MASPPVAVAPATEATTLLATKADAAATPATPSAPRHLAHLDGFRTVATLWVLMEHLSHLADGDFVYILGRANVAVDYYMLLSGLVTAYARPVARPVYYARRFGRVLVSYWAAQHRQSGRLGGATAGHHGLLGLHPKA